MPERPERQTRVRARVALIVVHPLDSAAHSLRIFAAFRFLVVPVIRSSLPAHFQSEDTIRTQFRHKTVFSTGLGRNRAEV